MAERPGPAVIRRLRLPLPTRVDVMGCEPAPAMSPYLDYVELGQWSDFTLRHHNTGLIFAGEMIRHPEAIARKVNDHVRRGWVRDGWPRIQPSGGSVRPGIAGGGV